MTNKINLKEGIARMQEIEAAAKVFTPAQTVARDAMKIINQLQEELQEAKEIMISAWCESHESRDTLQKGIERINEILK